MTRHHGSLDLRLRLLPGRYVYLQLHPADLTRDLLSSVLTTSDATFAAIMRTGDEVTVILPDAAVPPGLPGRARPGWAALIIDGDLDFELVGILSTLAQTLAAARIPMCAASTWSTDILLVDADHLSAATAALRRVAEVIDTPAG